MVFTSVASLVLRFILARENKRRDDFYGPVPPPSLLAASSSPSQKSLEAAATGPEAVLGLGPTGDAFEDLTDFQQQKAFRYSL